MAFDFNKLRGAKKTAKVSLGDQKVTVTELPLAVLLRVKKLQGVLAKAASRMMQKTPLGKQDYVTETVGKGSEGEMVVETSSQDVPKSELIDKSVEIREEGLQSLLDTLLNEEFLFDLLQGAVIEFQAIEKEDLLGMDGLTVPMMMLLLKGILEVNMKDVSELGNFFSLLKSQALGGTAASQ